MSGSEELKARGNKAFAEKRYDQAISLYTDALDLDDTNHTIYSNRSGAYCATQRYRQAEADARKAIALKPDWPRGYTRLGAALEGQEDWAGAIDAYTTALGLDPSNENIRADLEHARERFECPPPCPPDAGILNPDVLAALRRDPRFSDPSFTAILDDIMANPKSIGRYQGDSRLAKLMQAALQIFLRAKSPPKEPAPRGTPAADDSGLSPAEAAKRRGDDAFKACDLDAALSAYDLAISLDPGNVTLYGNKAATLNRQGRHREAIEAAELGIAKGRAAGAPYGQIAKAYQKVARAHAALGDLDAAIEALSASLLEKQDPVVKRELKAIRDRREKQRAKEYEDPRLAEEARLAGNEAFKTGDYPRAIEQYTEAIRRAPRNPTMYSNRAAAYSKLGEFPMAIKDCDAAIAIDSNFVKAYTRKGFCHFTMKEYNRARDCYNQALRIDPNNAEALSGIENIEIQLSKHRQERDPEIVRRAMADPEIQGILADPGMQQVIADMQENPQRAFQYLSDPQIREGISKLRAAGLL
jgi:stress-induced-phosphoprotein 1